MKKTIATRTIRLDSGTQCRVSINNDAVAEYTAAMLNGDKFPPVDVFWDGTEYHCADGFHRLLAAGRAEINEFSAIVHNGTVDDALWFAISANRSNGVARTGNDKRKAIELALVKFPQKTQEAIAQHVGCDQAYVQRISKELMTSHKLTPPATRTGKDGKTRPTSYKPRQPKGEPETPAKVQNAPTPAPAPAKATPAEHSPEPAPITEKQEAINHLEAEFWDLFSESQKIAAPVGFSLKTALATALTFKSYANRFQDIADQLAGN